MRKKLSLILIFSLLFCINATTFVMADTNVDYCGEVAICGYSVIDGQAIRTTRIGSDVGTIDIEGYTKNHCDFNSTSALIDGNMAVSIKADQLESPQNDDGIQPRGYTRQSNPAFGTSKDYTVHQGSTNKNIELTTRIAQATVSIISLAIQVWIPLAAGAADMAENIINLALQIGSYTKTIYLKEIKYGHKTIPALYHKYVQRWYLSNSYSGLYAESIVYDYWS